MSSIPFQAIIFDHDGTLVDTETPDYEACRMMCYELGITLAMETWAAKVVGRMDGYDFLFEDIIRQHHNGLTHNDLWQRLRQLWAITLQDTGLMPGVMPLLDRLQTQGYAMGVATAAERDWAMRWLTHFKLLPYFQAIATGDDVSNNKPAPDVYLLAARQLRVEPEQCLVFEDSLAGVQSAKSAGMTVVAVPSHLTQSLDFSQADGTINSLDDVTLTWIEKLAQKTAR